MLPTNTVVKKAIESLWDASANVYEATETVDEYGTSSVEEKLVYKDVKCRLSHKTSDVALKSDTIDTQAYDVVMYCSNEFSIKSGSRITITAEGRLYECKNAGEPLVYRHHQEIPLTLVKERP